MGSFARLLGRSLFIKALESKKNARKNRVSQNPSVLILTYFSSPSTHSLDSFCAPGPRARLIYQRAAGCCRGWWLLTNRANIFCDPHNGTCTYVANCDVTRLLTTLAAYRTDTPNKKIKWNNINLDLAAHSTIAWLRRMETQNRPTT